MFKNTKKINELNRRLNELSELVHKLEEGIMHDDYPKCLAPKDCGFSLCKHGRLSIKNAINADSLTFNNGEIKGRMNKIEITNTKLKKNANKTKRTRRN